MQVITFRKKLLQVKIGLTASKSISNRLIIIRQILSDMGVNSNFIINNLSDAEDTQILLNAINKNDETINIKNAGTCLRFLTAYFAACSKKKINLLCDERMKMRPLQPLTDALIKLGADITFTEQYGFAPLVVNGKQLNGGTLEINAEQSSQFASALMLIAPLLNQPLELVITGKIASAPYIVLTAKLLNQIGITVNVTNNRIVVNHTIKQGIQSYRVESDWSSAAFWYLAAGLSNTSNITLEDLSPNAIQGDAILHSLANNFGINSVYINNNIHLSNNTKIITPVNIDLLYYPDLAPALICLAAAKNIKHTFTGLDTLNFKESKRLDALINELKKTGAELIFADNKLLITKGITEKKENIVLNTYNDHRIAMAFSMLALVLPNIILDNLYVTEKSYPKFSEHLIMAGFTIQNV